MLPVLVGQFAERHVRADRGIVDQDVDAAEFGERVLRHRLDLILLCHIGDDREGPDTERLRFADDRVGFRLVGACIDDDMRALTGEMQHSRPADIAARTRDQRDLALKFTHDDPPSILSET